MAGASPSGTARSSPTALTTVLVEKYHGTRSMRYSPTVARPPRGRSQQNQGNEAVSAAQPCSAAESATAPSPATTPTRATKAVPSA